MIWLNAYRRVLLVCAALAGVLLATLTVLVGINVIVRNVGLGSLSWLHEVGEYVLYLTAYLSAPWILHHGGHVAVDVLANSLPAPMKRNLETVTSLLGGAACLLLLGYGVRATLDAHANASYRLQELAVAEWWLLALLPCSALLMCAEFALRLIRPKAFVQTSRTIRDGAPAGVPPGGPGA